MKNQVISISEVVAAVRQGGHIRRQPGDEVLKVGNKFANISEFVRTLRTLKGKGEAFLQIGTRIFYGKVEE